MHLPTLKTKTLPLLFLALLSLILVTPLNADIFRTLPTAWPAYFNAIGGNIIYSSAATVNNAAATLTLYGFDRPRSEISNFFKTRPQLTQELSRQKNTQLFIMQTAIDKSVAFIVEYHQTPPPSTPLSWPDLPQPPGAEPDFTATLAATHTTIVRATIPLPPHTATTTIHNMLHAKGWQLAAPATPSLSLYQRHNATFTALTLPGNIPGTSTITLLQRLGEQN